MNPYATLALPTTYFLTWALLVGLGLEAVAYRRSSWGIPAAAVYLTVGVWYLFEVLVSPPDPYLRFSADVLWTGFGEVAVFLVAFRVLLGAVVPEVARGSTQWTRGLPPLAAQAERALPYIAGAWAVIIVYGCWRMGWNVPLALFPVEGRAGTSMWGRPAVGGATDFIVSTAQYIHLFLSTSVVLLVFFLTKHRHRLVAMGLAAVSLPYFLLMGSRNVLIAVALPAVLAYLLVHRHRVGMKAVLLLGAAVAGNVWLRIVVAFRNVGFRGVLSDFSTASSQTAEQQHFGVNMAEELLHINTFMRDGLLPVKYGSGYVDELLNVVPRALYPNKPLLGIDYAILRGQGGAWGDHGLFSTISTGMIGQGVINFGPLFGPIVAALLVVLWVGFLTRLWLQRASLPRLLLFLAGVGITPNLGREVTLLVLWPIVFGYCLIRAYEAVQRGKAEALGQRGGLVRYGAGRAAAPAA